MPAFKPITIRDYSKIVFFYPLFIYSVVAWIIEHFFASGLGNPTLSWVSLIWMAIFFVNLLVVAFDFPVTKFFILIMVIVIVGLIFLVLYILGVYSFTSIDIFIQALLTLELKSNFYGYITVILGIMLILAVVSARFKYVRIEENEVLVKTVLIGQLNRFSTSLLRYKKEIIDVFEYIALGAGRITLMFSTEDIHILNTVPRINKVSKKIDQILDVIQVSIAKKP